MAKFTILTITLNMVYNLFICTIIFITQSFKIILFKDPAENFGKFELDFL